MKRPIDRDTISQMSQDSSDSGIPPMSIPASEIRRRLSDFFQEEKSKQFTHDPEDPSAAVLKEPWQVSLVFLSGRLIVRSLSSVS